MKYRLSTSTRDLRAANDNLMVVVSHLNGWLERGLPQLVSISVENQRYCVTLDGELPVIERDHISLTEV